MAAHGIATKVTNRRAYAGTTYRRFSYAHPGESENWPSVWVQHSNDNTRARELMREIGIEPTTRHAAELANYRSGKNGRRNPRRVANRVRIAALVALCVAIALYVARLMSL